MNGIGGGWAWVGVEGEVGGERIFNHQELQHCLTVVMKSLKTN